MHTDATVIFKIERRSAWEAACREGEYRGSADDVRDGFIHLSGADQVQRTAEKYFRGVEDLVLIAIDAARLGATLKWEASRGGDLYPHVYGPLPTAAALWVRRLPLGADGVPLVPGDLAPC